MKNHQLIDGRLLQTNKKFSALKESQKTRIAEWEYEAYKNCYLKYKRVPNKLREDEILYSVIDKIEIAEIWIPQDEIYKHYQGRYRKLLKRLKKEFSKDFQEDNVTE
jgi:8-oxo-dGTP diphosphatase